MEWAGHTSPRVGSGRSTPRRPGGRGTPTSAWSHPPPFPGMPPMMPTSFPMMPVSAAQRLFYTNISLLNINSIQFFYSILLY